MSTVKSEFALHLHSTIQIKISLVIAFTLTLSGQDSGDLLHVLVVGHAGLAVGPVLEDRLHVVVDREALGGAGGGMLAPQ